MKTYSTGFVKKYPSFLEKKVLRIMLFILPVLILAGNDLRLIAVLKDVDAAPALLLALMYLLSFAVFIPLMLNRNAVVRTLAEILLFVALYTDAVYIILGNYPFSSADAINLFNNAEYASGAIVTFRMAFLLAFACAGMLFALIRLSLHERSRNYHPVWSAGFIIILALLVAYAGERPGMQDFLPSVYRVSANLIPSDKLSPEDVWKRGEVTEKPGKMRARHIFLIVDESVAGEALSINGFPVATTPYLEANRHKFLNFGKAVSFTNYSAGSNLALMAGLQMKELPDQRFTAFLKPGIYRFAQNAGYITYLLDGQSGAGRLQNYTTPKDLCFIDTVFKTTVAYPAAPAYTHDSILAEKIARIAALNVPTFTYVNKAGAHWPYSSSTPHQVTANRFSTLDTKKSTDMYFKSLWWNVDKFWETLNNKLADDSSVLIVYTSDHGENFASQSFRIKHASIFDSPLIEGIVPLLVVDKAGLFPAGYKPTLDKHSHQEIFPTLLNAMGYSARFVGENYGRGLMDKPAGERRCFMAGDVFGRGKNTFVFADK